MQALLDTLAGERLLHSAHDCSEGGLAVALAECAIIGGTGFVSEGVEAPPPDPAGLGDRWDAALFGEAPSRVIVSCAPEQAQAVLARASANSVPALRLGGVGGGRFTFAGLIDEPLNLLVEAYEGGLEKALEG